jgi:RND family efflux transporter MFP subunit
MINLTRQFFLGCALLSSAMVQAGALETVGVQRQVMPLERLVEGSVEAIAQTTVSAETSGRIDKVLFDVGDKVPAGAVILSMLGIDQKESLVQAEALLAEARSLRQAESSQFERIKALYDKKLVSKANYDNALASLNSAKAREASADAAIKRAKQQLSYTEVKAAYSGVVSARHVEIGEAVQPGTPLMTGFDPDHLRVYVDLPQTLAQQVKANPSIRILLDNAQSIQPIKVTYFPIADKQTGTVRMRLELPEFAATYPGQLVKVAVVVGERARVLVPASSVVYRAEVAGVYVVDSQGAPKLRQVRLGSRFGDQIEVLAGVSESEQVALDPVAAGISATEQPVQKGE